MLPKRDVTAIDLVARHGHLAPEKLWTLAREEIETVCDYIEEHQPELAAELSAARAAGDGAAVYLLETLLCGWLNLKFDEASVAAMQQLPKAWQVRFRAMPITEETWNQLIDAAIWWHARPRDLHRWRPRSPHDRQHCCRAPLRRGPRRREPRRRSVRSGPRRARAPGRLGDDDPEPEHVVRHRRRVGVAA